MLHSHDQAQWPEAGGGGQTDWRCRAFTALLRSPLLPPPAMASVVCGEATLPAYNASSGLNYCSGASAPLLCAALYGPGAYAAAPRTGACVRAPATPTQLPCPPGYAPACGSASCICAPLQSGGGGSLLPGQNASQGTAAASISALQASPGAPCATPLACFFAQSLPYALGALGALALALLLALYCLRRCLCPRSSFPLCCLRWRCARAAGRACGCGRCCSGGGGGGGRAGKAGGAGRSARLRAAARWRPGSSSSRSRSGGGGGRRGYTPRQHQHQHQHQRPAPAAAALRIAEPVAAAEAAREPLPVQQAARCWAVPPLALPAAQC